MANRSNFTPDEWKKVLSSPMLAGMAVTLADPSGLWGMMKEGMASARALLDVKADAGASELLKAVVADFETSEGRSVAREGLKAELSGKAPGEMKRKVLEGLAEAGRILDTKAPGDAEAFKAWLNRVAQKVAEAASEGGTLGFGGVKVSDAEKASLSDVSQALRRAA
jgi:hypothetical protein